jgi:DUF1365 family protein
MAWNCTATKVFHVSPFCNVEGGYRFRFMRTAPLTPHAPWCASTTTTPMAPAADQRQRHAATAHGRRHPPALWRYPAMTLGVSPASTGRPCKLWLKRVRFFQASRPLPTLS